MLYLDTDTSALRRLRRLQQKLRLQGEIKFNPEVQIKKYRYTFLTSEKKVKPLGKDCREARIALKTLQPGSE